VNVVLGYAAPELAAWVSAHREAVLRAAEAVETAYMAAVDELAPRLPGGVGAWERARGSVLFYDSERAEHLARPSTTVENVEGWRSRALDSHGKRSVVALLPVRALNVANRWVHGFGSANGSLWTMTRLAPSPETPLELASYDIRRMGVDVTQQTGEDGGGGSTMPNLDAAHNALLQVLRLAPRNPLAAERLDFGPVAMSHYMSRAGLPDELTDAVVAFRRVRSNVPVRLVRPSQVAAVRETLVSEGVVVPVVTDTYGRVRLWGFAPVEKFATQEAYNSALAAIRERVGA
jgi:hypothetical protein